MKIRGLIVAAIVFLILSGTLYWSEHHKPAEAAKVSANAPPAILKLDASAITGLDLKRKGVEPVVLAKADSGKWQITQPKPLGADQTTVAGIASTLSSLNSERLVDEKAADLKTYGLEQPALEVDVTEKDNQTQKLLIGDDTPTSGAVYAMLAGSPRVFTMSTYAKSSVDKSLNDVRDKRLLTMDADKISRIDLIRKNQDVEFSRNAGQTSDAWRIVKPEPLRADSVQVGELARKLADARMDLGASGSEDAAQQFARATPIATATIADASGTQELQIRKSHAGKDGNSGTYYAKSSVVSGAYQIDPGLGQSVDKNLEDFRDKKLFDFGYGDPSKVEFHDGSKAYFLVRSGEDWWRNGKKMDAGNVQSLVSDLRDLTADKFLDSGFPNPTIEAVVTSEDGKRVEKVRIAKSKTGYVAKRENEPALYQLTSQSVDDLRKAAGEIQPAATPGK
jgi:Domain of unknown function (DUF4340)